MLTSLVPPAPYPCLGVLLPVLTYDCALPVTQHGYSDSYFFLFLQYVTVQGISGTGSLRIGANFLVSAWPAVEEKNIS